MSASVRAAATVGPPGRWKRRHGIWTPQIEVYERDGKLHVRADLPGLKPEDINVNVEDDVLTVSGERRDEREEKREGYFHSERSYGRFERSLALPRGVDPNAIECKFENGVLSLEAPLPKQESRGRSIPIGKSGGELPKETKTEKPH
jgi:HSP20 family protein